MNVKPALKIITFLSLDNNSFTRKFAKSVWAFASKNIRVSCYLNEAFDISKNGLFGVY